MLIVDGQHVQNFLATKLVSLHSPQCITLCIPLQHVKRVAKFLKSKRQRRTSSESVHLLGCTMSVFDVQNVAMIVFNLRQLVKGCWR